MVDSELSKVQQPIKRAKKDPALDQPQSLISIHRQPNSNLNPLGKATLSREVSKNFESLSYALHQAFFLDCQNGTIALFIEIYINLSLFQKYVGIYHFLSTRVLQNQVPKKW